MKKILIGLICFISFAQVFGQSAGNDTTKYIYYRYTYGNALDRYWAKRVIMIPDDTTYSKDGLAMKAGILYTGNGTKWTAVGAGGSGSADSTIFATLYRLDTTRIRINSDLSARLKIADTTVFRRKSDSTASPDNYVTHYQDDTAKTNLRTAIAGKVSNLAASTGIRAGAYLSRPAAANCQCYYWSTDSAFWSYDNGSWKDLKPGTGGGAAFDSTTAQGASPSNPYHTQAGNDVRYASSTLPSGSMYIGNGSNVASAGCNWPAETSLGYTYQDSVWYTNYRWQRNGAITTLINSDGSVTTSGGDGTYNNFLSIGKPEVYNKKTLTVRFKITNATSTTTYGFGIGGRWVNSTFKYDVLGRVDFTNGGNAGKVFLESSGGAAYNSTSGFVFSQNDSIQYDLTRNDSVWTFRVSNLTTGATPTTISYTFANTYSQSNINANLNTLGIYEFGGTHKISYIGEYVADVKNPSVLVVADSKGIYYGGSYAATWPHQISSNYTSTTIWAGGGDRMLYELQGLENLANINGKIILIQTGSNDKRASVTDAVLMSYYDSAYNRLIRGGASVYFLLMPEDSTAGGIGQKGIDLALRSRYPNNYLSAVWDSLVNGGTNILKSAYDAGDHIHINAAGNAKVYQALVATGKLSTCTLRVIPARKTDPMFVATTNETVPSPALKSRLDSLEKNSGGGGAGITIGTFSGSSQTNGANYSGGTLTFGPADGTNPGMVTTGTQTIAGDKNHTGKIGVANPTMRYPIDLNGQSTASQVHIGTSTNDDGFYLTASSGTSGFFQAGAAYNGSNWIAKGNNAAIVGMGGIAGGITWYGNTSLTTGNSFTPTELMRLNSSGNLLVGRTVDSLALLQLAGSTTGRAQMYWQGSSNAPSSLKSGHMWVDTTGSIWSLNFRANGQTYNLLSALQTLTYNQLATTNTLAISGGNTQTFLPATSSLAGLLDTARARYIDSARQRLINFSVAGKNGVTYRSTDTSFIQGGAYDQRTAIGGGGVTKTEGTPGSNLDSFAVYASGKIYFNKVPVVAGSPLVVAYAGTDQTGVTTTQLSGTTCPADGIYEASGWLLINSLTSSSVKLQISFTDHNNNVQTIDLIANGATVADNAATGYYVYATVCFKAKAGANMGMNAIKGSGAVNYDWGWTIKQLRP